MVASSDTICFSSDGSATTSDFSSLHAARSTSDDSATTLVASCDTVCFSSDGSATKSASSSLHAAHLTSDDSATTLVASSDTICFASDRSATTSDFSSLHAAHSTSDESATTSVASWDTVCFSSDGSASTSDPAPLVTSVTSSDTFGSAPDGFATSFADNLSDILTLAETSTSIASHLTSCLINNSSSATLLGSNDGAYLAFKGSTKTTFDGPLDLTSDDLAEGIVNSPHVLAPVMLFKLPPLLKPLALFRTNDLCLDIM